MEIIMATYIRVDFHRTLKFWHYIKLLLPILPNPGFMGLFLGLSASFVQNTIDTCLTQSKASVRPSSQCYPGCATTSITWSATQLVHYNYIKISVVLIDLERVIWGAFCLFCSWKRVYTSYKPQTTVNRHQMGNIW